MLPRFFVVWAVFLSAGVVAAAPRLYVDADAVGGASDGSSWEDAFVTLDAALKAAPAGSEVFVAEGVYIPQPGMRGDLRDVSFVIRDGVTIAGGYAGWGEDDPDLRDVREFETVLSGDIGVVGDSLDNCYHVVYLDHCGEATVVDGFTITGGNANGGYPHLVGGGVLCDYGSPVIKNCRIVENEADQGGGGLYNRRSSSKIVNTVFEENYAEQNGGGLCNWQSRSEIVNCDFVDNAADTRGGGMYNDYSFSVVANSIFWGNEANQDDQIGRNGAGDPSVVYCCVDGGYIGVGNISSDPRLAEGIEIAKDSPCVDAGSNGFVPEWVVSDVAGWPRIMDGDGDGVSKVDMGVFELWSDCNSNGVVDSEEIAEGSSPDCNGNGVPDECELLPVGRVYVNQAAVDGLNDGADWQNAFLSLADALVYAKCTGTVTEVWVASGRYRPAEPGDVDARGRSFELVSQVKVLGGFAGTEDQVDQRDPELNRSILTGDLAENDIVPDGPDLLGGQENSRHVVTVGEKVRGAVLDGVTVSRGYALGGDGDFDSCGGGVLNLGGEVELRDCVLSHNYAARGGGLYSSEGTLVLLDSEFVENVAIETGGGAVNRRGTAEIRGCLFSGNELEEDEGDIGSGLGPVHMLGVDWNALKGSLRMGGGLYNERTCTVVADCVFSDNYGHWGGGMGNVENCHPTIVRCVFRRNRAASAGGMLNFINCCPVVSSSSFLGNLADNNGGGMLNYVACSPVMTNCVFSGNYTGVYGAGGAMANVEGAAPNVSNSTFIWNDAKGGGGGLLNFGGSNPVVVNSVIWGNRAPDGPQFFDDVSSSMSFSYGCIEGGHTGVGNTSDDPRLVRYPNAGENGWGDEDDDYGDLRLVEGSPCLDSGADVLLSADVADLDGDGDTQEALPFDAAGELRVEDGNIDGQLVVDMGAYELWPDCNSNGVHDHNDALAGSADCDVNGVLDECELAVTDCNGSGVPDVCEPLAGGDFDLDGDVDLVDYGVFADCLAGPGIEPIPALEHCGPSCLMAFDADGDGDVDLQDYGVVFGVSLGD